MNRINTLAELKAERKRLFLKKAELEIILKSDYEQLKTELEPSKLLIQVASKAFAQKHEDIIGHTTKSLMNLLIRKVVFRNSGPIIKFIGNFVAQKVTNRVVSEKKSSIANWVLSLLDKVTAPKEPDPEKNFANAGYPASKV